MIIIIDEKSLDISPDIVQLSSLLSNYPYEDKTITFSNFSYEIYEQSFDVCKKYMNKVILDRTVKINTGTLSCLNYMACDQVLDYLCKYIASFSISFDSNDYTFIKDDVMNMSYFKTDVYRSREKKQPMRVISPFISENISIYDILIFHKRGCKDSIQNIRIFCKSITESLYDLEKILLSNPYYLNGNVIFTHPDFNFDSIAKYKIKESTIISYIHLILSNPNISTEKVINMLKLYDLSKYILYWNILSCNKGLDLNYVKNNPNLPWKWRFLSKHPKLTMEFILEFLDKKWCWNAITRNSNITSEDVQKYPDMPWDQEYLLKKVKKVVRGDAGLTNDIIRRIVSYINCDL